MADGLLNLSGTEQLPRCCERHPDWPTLAQHLLEEFTDVPINVLVREVARAREAADSAGLTDPDALHVGELIARHQLMLLSGRTSEIARLDPERHTRTAS
jgi:hypothetical protein